MNKQKFDIYGIERSWQDMTDLKPEEYIINQWLHKLDQTALEYEAKWGVGRLPSLVSPSLNHKWNTQQDKLTEAIRDRDHKRVQQLVEGAIRGYAALEADALDAGYKPHVAPYAWTVAMPSGGQLAICDTHARAASLQAILTPQNNMIVMTIEEIAALVAARRNVVYNQSTTTNAPKPLPERFFERGGDDIPL